MASLGPLFVRLPEDLRAAALSFLSLSDLLLSVPLVSSAFQWRPFLHGGAVPKSSPIMLALANNRGTGRSWTIAFDWSYKRPSLPDDNAYATAVTAVSSNLNVQAMDMMTALGSLPRLYLNARFLDFTNVGAGFIPFVRILAQSHTTIQGLVMPLHMMSGLRLDMNAEELASRITTALRANRQEDKFLADVTADGEGAVSMLSQSLRRCTKMRRFIAVDDEEHKPVANANMDVEIGSFNYRPVFQAWADGLVEVQIWIQPTRRFWNVNQFITELVEADPKGLRHLVLTTANDTKWQKPSDAAGQTELKTATVEKLLNASFAKDLQTLVLQLPWDGNKQRACVRLLADGRLQQLRQIGLMGLDPFDRDPFYFEMDHDEAEMSEGLQRLIVNNSMQLEAFVVPESNSPLNRSSTTDKLLKSAVHLMNVFRALLAIPTMRRIYGIPLAIAHVPMRVALGQLMQSVRKEAKFAVDVPDVQFFPLELATTWTTWTSLPASEWSSSRRSDDVVNWESGKIARVGFHQYLRIAYDEKHLDMIVRTWPWRREEDNYPVVVWRPGDNERHAQFEAKQTQDLKLVQFVAEFMGESKQQSQSRYDDTFMWQEELREYRRKNIDLWQFQSQLSEALSNFRRPVAVLEGGHPVWWSHVLTPLTFKVVDAKEGLTVCTKQRIAKDTLLLLEQGQTSTLRRRLAAMLLLSKDVWKEAVLTHAKLDDICKGASQDSFSYFPGQFTLAEWNTALRIASVKLAETFKMEHAYQGPETESWPGGGRFRYASFPFTISHIPAEADVSETNVRLAFIEPRPGDPAVIAGVFATRDIEAGEELIRTVMPGTTSTVWREQLVGALARLQPQQQQQMEDDVLPPPRGL